MALRAALFGGDHREGLGVVDVLQQPQRPVAGEPGALGVPGGEPRAGEPLFRAGRHPQRHSRTPGVLQRPPRVEQGWLGPPQHGVHARDLPLADGAVLVGADVVPVKA